MIIYEIYCSILLITYLAKKSKFEWIGSTFAIIILLSILGFIIFIIVFLWALFTGRLGIWR